MIQKWRMYTVILVLFLLTINIILFARTIVIGDSIAKLERNIHQMQITNMDLEQKYYTLTSFDHLTNAAENLGFTHESQPISLSNFTFALAK